MDPIIGSAVIGGVSSLLGGLFGSRQKAKYVVPDYAGIRRKAEAAGFNPLTALTQGPQGQVVQSQNYMGQAIADAGLLLADGMQKKADEQGEIAQLKKQNEDLREKLTNQTLRPKVPGIYAQTESTPSLRQALGVQGEISSDPAVVGRSGHRGGSGVVGAVQPVTPPAMDRYNLYVEVYDPMTGRYSRIPNPDLMDTGPVEMATGMAVIGAADAAQNGGGYIAKSFGDGFVDGKPWRRRSSSSPDIPYIGGKYH